MNLVGCCNELSAGYASDGYARSRGVGACVLTFTVGGLSALNAVAGAYSESIPLICIVGGPSSNYYGKNVTLHHTTGMTADFCQELKCFQAVTCYQAVVSNLEDAQEKIDAAIATALAKKLANPMCLEAAVEAATHFFNKATKPVLIAGSKLQTAKAAEQAFLQLADACGYATAVMPAAKGLVQENLNQFIGTYWGPASSPFCAEIVKSADARLYAGPIRDDLATLGFSTLFNKEESIIVQPNRVVIANALTFGGVLIEHFLEALVKTLPRNTVSYDNYKLMNAAPQGEVPLLGMPNEATLKISVLFKHIERMLSSNSVVIAEAGLTWFDCQKLKLPHGYRYESQMLYASIGWSVGATLGYALAAPDKRIIACIGDGSFQIAAQEVSTMMRCGQNSIIFLINNGGYTTEVQIHDGPYNVIKNWDYSALVEAIWNRQGKCSTAKVCCEEELVAAIESAMGEHKDSLCFIEVIAHKNDTSKELIEFGSRLAAANSASSGNKN